MLGAKEIIQAELRSGQVKPVLGKDVRVYVVDISNGRIPKFPHGA